MKSLRVYLPSVHHTSWFSQFSQALCRQFLESHYAIDYARSHASCTSTSFPKYHCSQGSEITVHPYSLALEDLETGEFQIFTSHYRPMDLFRTYGFDLWRLKRLCSAHFNGHLAIEVDHLLRRDEFCKHDANVVKEKISPWMFRPETWAGLDVVEATFDPAGTIPKAYFRGVKNRARECLETLQSDNDFAVNMGTFTANNKLSETDYFAELLGYRVALSVPGAGDMCHRDIECFAMGIPVLRPRFSCELMYPIPDDCYIPVDFVGTEQYLHDPECFKPWHPQDPAKLARDLGTRLREVIGEEDYLNAVAANAYRHYLNHYKWPQPGIIALDAVRSCF
ncbi:MAG: hypothetical protein AB8B57_10230 [Congregibacter sp.]